MECYKEIIKDRIRSKRKLHPKYTAAYISDRLKIQSSYLSRVLNDPKFDLGEDLLYGICSALDLTHEEYWHVSLLRQYNTSVSAGRKKLLAEQIELARSNLLLTAEKQRLAEEAEEQIKYLKNPHAVVVHAALAIPRFAAVPERLCETLGITPSQLKQILNNLERLKYIDLDSRTASVVAVHKSHLHFGKDHPIMRVHQYIFQNFCLSHLYKTEEEDKENFLVTFAATREIFEKIRKEFRKFLISIEGDVIKAESEDVYQLSFSLFNWTKGNP